MTAQVVIVTGSTSGFGRLTVEALARQGHTVFAGMRHSTGKNSAAGAELREWAQQTGSTLHIVDLDVTDEGSVLQAVEQVLALAGRIDVVVNNAGVSFIGPIEAFTLEQVQQQFDTNLFSVLRMHRAVVPHMRAQGSGLLIQMSSVLGRVAYPATGIYAASKFALEGLTEAAWHELAPFGIEAVLVEPGTFSTKMATNGVPPNDRERTLPYAAMIPRVRALLAHTPGEAETADAAPQRVADAIAALVALPAGTRPLRTVVAVPSQRSLPAAINAAAEEIANVLRSATV